MYNKVLMMGRLTKDPETRYNGDMAVAKLWLANERDYKQEGGPEADFFEFTAFRKTAEFVQKYLRKGAKVFIDARMENDNYTNKDGVKVYRNSLIINSIDFADSKKSDGGDAAKPTAKTESSTTKTVSKPGTKPATKKEEAPAVPDNDGFMAIPEGIDAELPFA